MGHRLPAAAKLLTKEGLTFQRSAASCTFRAVRETNHANRNQPSCTIVPQQFRVLYLPLGRTRILRPAEPTGCCNHNSGSAAVANAPPVGSQAPAEEQSRVSPGQAMS